MMALLYWSVIVSSDSVTMHNTRMLKQNNGKQPSVILWFASVLPLWQNSLCGKRPMMSHTVRCGGARLLAFSGAFRCNTLWLVSCIAKLHGIWSIICQEMQLTTAHLCRSKLWGLGMFIIQISNESHWWLTFVLANHTYLWHHHRARPFQGSRELDIWLLSH